MIIYFEFIYNVLRFALTVNSYQIDNVLDFGTCM